MSKFKKSDMAAKAASAAASAPGFEQRLAHAQAVTGHPLANDPARTNNVSPPLSPATDTAGEFIEVPLDLVDPNPFNARTVYRPERIKEMQASLAANGQETPGTATIRNGRYILGAGHYRRLGLLANGAPTMLLRIKKNLTDQQLYELSYRENAEREGQSAFDNAMSWKKLIAEKVYSSETEIEHATGLSLSTVNKTMSIAKLDPQILDIVQSNPVAFGLSVLYEILQLQTIGGVDVALTATNDVLNEKVSRRELEARRIQLAMPKKPRKQKEMSRTYKLDAGGTSFGTLKEWDNGKLLLDVVINDDAQRRKLMDLVAAELGSKL
jgi:ParB family chromosome partitioning protein